jgi:hypothetical protein
MSVGREKGCNLFLLLCIVDTTEGSMKLQAVLNHSSPKWKKLLDFIKLYLSMEEWLHDCNSNIWKDLKCVVVVWSGPVRSVPIEFPRKCISVNPRNCRYLCVSST